MYMAKMFWNKKNISCHKKITYSLGNLFNIISRRSKIVRPMVSNVYNNLRRMNNKWIDFVVKFQHNGKYIPNFCLAF